MRTILILSFITLLKSLTFGQTKSAENYIIFYEEPNTAKYFKMGKSAYLDYYLLNKVKFGDNEYYANVTNYSWGQTDTAYYREDTENYYHFNPKVNSESIVLPKKIIMGQKWLESDSSWSYKIIGIDNELQTPVEFYKELIVIQCTQLTGRDKNKSKTYHIYYKKGIGMVGSVIDGKLISYLAEIKKNVKKGEKIGG